MQFEKDTLGTKRVVLGLFWPTLPTGVPRDPVDPQNWFPLRLLQVQAFHESACKLCIRLRSVLDYLLDVIRIAAQ